MHGMFSSEQVLTTDPHNDGAGFAILIIAALMLGLEIALLVMSSHPCPYPSTCTLIYVCASPYA